MGEEFNMENFMQYYDPDTEGILSNTSLSDGISTVLEIINILIFLIDVTVILLMFVKCRKFRTTRAYEDFAGTKNLAKALEIITIFLAIDAVYSLTRIFVIIDAINLLKQIIPDLPASLFMYSIAVNIVLPVLSFVISVCVWNMYHNTKKLFYSIYPNGALPVIDVDLKKPGAGSYGADNNTNPAAYSGSKPMFKSNIQAMSDSFEAYKSAASVSASREEDIFGTGASVEYLTGVNKSDEAKMEELLIQDEPKTPIRPADNGDTNAPSDEDDSIFGTGNSTDWQPVGDIDSTLLSDMPSGREEDGGIDLGSDDGGLFGTGTSADYMKTDEAKFAELLISEDNEQDKGLELGGGDLFGSGNSTDWQPVGDIDSALLSDMPSGREEDGGIDLGSNDGSLFGTGTSANYMKTDEAKFAELLISEDNERDNGLDLGGGNGDLFGSGTTEDYMKRFTSADEVKIAELLVQDEPEGQ